MHWYALMKSVSKSPSPSGALLHQFRPLPTACPKCWLQSVIMFWWRHKAVHLSPATLDPRTMKCAVNLSCVLCYRKTQYDITYVCNYNVHYTMSIFRMHRNMCIQYKVLQDTIIIVIRGNTVYYGIFFWHQTPSEIQLTSLRGKCWQEPNPEQSSPLPSAKFAILAQSSFQTRAPNSDTAVGPVPLSHLQQVAMVFPTASDTWNTRHPALTASTMSTYVQESKARPGCKWSKCQTSEFESCWHASNSLFQNERLKVLKDHQDGSKRKWNWSVNNRGKQGEASLSCSRISQHLHKTVPGYQNMQDMHPSKTINYLASRDTEAHRSCFFGKQCVITC